MNGYERNSEDYGGPPVGWGTWLILVVMIGAVVMSVIVGLWRLVSG